MKISAEALETLHGAIAPHDTAERRAAYLSGNFPRSHTVKDLDKRYRHDLLRAVPSPWICDVLYGELGMNDSHIDTALRRIIPPLGEEAS
jgi:hypothetical protein